MCCVLLLPVLPSSVPAQPPDISHATYRAIMIGTDGPTLDEVELVVAPSDVIRAFGTPASVDTGGDPDGARMLLTLHYEGLRLQYEGVAADVLWLRDVEVTSPDHPLRIDGTVVTVGDAVDSLDPPVQAAFREDRARLYVRPPADEATAESEDAYAAIDFFRSGDTLDRVRLRRLQ